jgi:hypothetical protein
VLYRNRVTSPWLQRVRDALTPRKNEKLRLI